MPEMVLDDLERGAGIEQVRGDRVPERMRGEVMGQLCAHSVAHEAQLDLSTLERPGAASEERLVRIARRPRQVPSKQHRCACEEYLLAPGATLEPPYEESSAIQLDVPPTQEEHLSHAQAVVVHQGEERPVTRIRDGREEAPGLVLSQVARDLLMGMREDGQRGQGNNRAPITARSSRKAQSGDRAWRWPVESGSGAS